MNKVVLIGRLTKDPEQAATASGIPVCRFTVAVSRAFKNANGERDADFIPVIVWRAAAENCSKYLRKGSQCAVSGCIQTRNYEDKEGIRRYITEIVADSVSFLDPKSSAEKETSEHSNIEDLTPVTDEDLPF